MIALLAVIYITSLAVGMVIGVWVQFVRELGSK